ncbi:unnamed protein product [Rotaria sp. Silwood2]|nr:unnamed protein product [Rotaria sp. Silwood2]CAF4595607.1 unnamed protein product [Rotaria sp. Silwood2]
MAAFVTQKMLDTGLFKVYSSMAFNNLGRLNRIIECNGEGEQAKRIESIIDNLAHVFVKHHMHDLLGVCLVHNHFRLNDGEYVEKAIKPIDVNVQQLMGNYLTDGHSFAFHIKTSTSSSMEATVSYMWAYAKNTNAYFLIQFFDANNKKIVQRLAELCERTNLIEFLNEYKLELNKDGLQNDLAEHNKLTEVFYEVTDVKIREQVLFVSPMGNIKKTYETIWS